MMVPDASFTSYYDQPILNEPVWNTPDVPGYFFLGGLAGAGSAVAAAARLSGRRRMARGMKIGSAVAVALSLVALIHDLGRPARFLNMLRTFKPTSPMSVGSWLLAGYGPAAAAAAFSEVSGTLPIVGTAASATAALAGPAVAAYTAVLFSDTAVPAWHDAGQIMPWVFASSSAASAAGLGLAVAPAEEAGPVQALGFIGGVAEVASELAMTRQLGTTAEVYERGTPKRIRSAAVALLAAGAVGSLAGRRRRWMRVLSGGALLAGSAATRFSIFEAGRASAHDPKYTVAPQRERIDARSGESGER